MKQYFADTSYWIAILNTEDALHTKAVELSQYLRGSLVTTQWVLAEPLDGFSDSGTRKGVSAFVRALEQQKNTVITPASDDWFHRGLSLYEQRQDKEWSLTDCISFITMENMEIVEALSADHHFEQAGFVALLK